MAVAAAEATLVILRAHALAALISHALRAGKLGWGHPAGVGALIWESWQPLTAACPLWMASRCAAPLSMHDHGWQAGTPHSAPKCAAWTHGRLGAHNPFASRVRLSLP